MASRRGRTPLEVWKFGGASLADAHAFARAVALVLGHRGPLAVVVSAVSGVTDQLLDGAHRSSSGDPRAGSEIAALIRQRHRGLILRLVKSDKRRGELLDRLEEAAREYQDLCRAILSIAHLPPRASDVLVSRGERLATALFAAALAEAGRHAVMIDADGLVITDALHGRATPDVAATRSSARCLLAPALRRGLTPVVPGFIGTGPDGSLTTLGRGGTDLTATVLGRCLGARRVVLWKDVPGILTADPRLVPDARLIPQLHHREAAEVAHYGAKVLHPRALIPIDQSRVVLHVRSFLDPKGPGTEVSGRRTLPRYPVKALATISGQALLTVAGKGMIGVPGIAARAFGALHTEGLSVSTIFQASSENSIGFTLPEHDSARALSALRKAFQAELASGLVDAITARADVAVVAVVGYGMAGTPGIAARVFTALAQGEINVIAIAQGSSERNISFVVQGSGAAEALRRVHAAFHLSKIGGGRPSPPRTDVVLLGFGRVGRALADLLIERNGAAGVRVVGLLDRSGYVFDPKGLSTTRLRHLARRKDEGHLLSSLGVRATAPAALTFIASHAVMRPVLVDVTADETLPLLRSALSHGFDLVLANKQPLSADAQSYADLHQAARAAGRRLRYEATVGAGLPILDTYRKLVESGDRVLRVEGCVSGTLGFVLSALDRGIPFSEALREARDRGYTEPDPRQDLSGRDAGRKGLILARLLGYRGQLAEPEDLTPAALRRLPLAEFLKRLPAFDDLFKRRFDLARRRGRVLRYVVRATPLSVRAELLEVPLDSAIGALRGTRNLISFTTKRYREEPLVIMGPGAGAEVTAAGILNDIHFLAST
jgi:aspartokinase/homoserine dehydrogenase 1